MRARIVWTLVLALTATCASGCLRNKFDLCAGIIPDPSCGYLDASNDAGLDAGSDAETPADVGLDAPADASADATTD